MTFDKKLSEEGADWIAEIVPAELVDLVREREVLLRAEHGDPLMDHQTMAGLLMPLMEEEGVPTQQGGVTPHLLVEILHWEDEFRSMAGQPRKIRPS
jgi:hypothetical protein